MTSTKLIPVLLFVSFINLHCNAKGLFSKKGLGLKVSTYHTVNERLTFGALPTLHLVLEVRRLLPHAPLTAFSIVKPQGIFSESPLGKPTPLRGLQPGRQTLLCQRYRQPPLNFVCWSQQEYHHCRNQRDLRNQAPTPTRHCDRSGNRLDLCTQSKLRPHFSLHRDWREWKCDQSTYSGIYRPSPLPMGSSMPLALPRAELLKLWIGKNQPLKSTIVSILPIAGSRWHLENNRAGSQWCRVF